MPAPLRILAPWEPITVARKLGCGAGVADGLGEGVGVVLAVAVGLIETVAEVDTDAVAVGVGLGRFAPPVCPSVSTVAAAPPTRTMPIATATVDLRWFLRKPRIMFRLLPMTLVGNRREISGRSP